MKSIGGKTFCFVFCFCLISILLVAAGFFIFPKSAFGEEKHIVINEIMVGQAEDSKNEFIELYNPTDSSINLEKYKLTKKTSSGSESNLISISKFSGTIPAQGYFLIAHPDYLEKISADLPYSGSSYSIADNNTILLYDKDGKLVDKVGYGMAKDFEGLLPAHNPADNKSTERKIVGEDMDDNNKDFETNDIPSPRNSEYGIEEKEESPKKEYSSKIRLNEILPNPSGDETKDEYIELYNYSSKDVDLENWEIEDAGTGKYVFSKGTEIKKENYLIIYRKDFGFAINNSNEIISLLNPDGVEIENVILGSKSFDSDISYSFDGVGWKRSSFLTPEKENEFDETTKIKIKKDDKIYRNIYANFEVKTGDKKQKVTWDFGDGSSKSYLQKTKHKYLKAGTYQVILTVKGKSDDLVENFTVEVEKFGQSKIKIISVKANPKGKDDKESITIQNNSKKKINLSGWSIATGWDNLYNHPISKKFVLKSGEKKEITKKYSKFTLNNKQTKIELRRPDGTVAAKIKYSKKEGVQDDEVYEKGENGWEWTKGENGENTETVNTEMSEDKRIDVDIAPDNMESTKDIAEENLANMQSNRIEDNFEIQLDEPAENGEVLGSETMKENIANNDNNKTGFFQSMLLSANQTINNFINFFF